MSSRSSFTIFNIQTELQMTSELTMMSSMMSLSKNISTLILQIMTGFCNSLRGERNCKNK